MNKEYRKRLLTFIGTISAIALWIYFIVGAYIYVNLALSLFILFLPGIIAIGTLVVGLIWTLLIEFWNWVKNARD